MPDDRRPHPPYCGQIPVSQTPYTPPTVPVAMQPGAVSAGGNAEMVLILREILAAQDRQNELLEELIGQVGSTQRQRANELGQWKQANPQLARACRKAAQSLGRIQTEFLMGLTREINENSEGLADGDFLLNEFIDRYGPRLAHLNGLLQVLCQLGSTPTPTTPSNP